MNVCQSQFSQALKGKVCIRGDLLLPSHFQLCCSLGVPGPVFQVGVPIFTLLLQGHLIFFKAERFQTETFFKGMVYIML